jgi:hypothetical protein
MGATPHFRGSYVLDDPLVQTSSNYCPRWVVARVDPTWRTIPSLSIDQEYWLNWLMHFEGNVDLVLKGSNEIARLHPDRDTNSI